jgi:hypothetical protein
VVHRFVPVGCLAMDLKPEAFHGPSGIAHAAAVKPTSPLEALFYTRLPFASRRAKPSFQATNMTFTVMLFVTRSPHLTFDEFQDYYEHKHIPLVYSLVSDVWPATFNRKYFARVSRKGFGGPANPDRPPLTLRGNVDELDCDCIAEMTFSCEKVFRKFYKKIYEKEIAAILAEDENNFLKRGRTRAVVIGETWSTNSDGLTTNEQCDVTRSDGSDSDISSSERSA